MTTIPARDLVDGDRVRVNEVHATLTEVDTDDDGFVRALGSRGEVFRWPIDHPVEREDG